MWDPPSTLLVNLHQNECRYMQYIVKSFLDSDFNLSMQKIQRSKKFRVKSWLIHFEYESG